MRVFIHDAQWAAVRALAEGAFPTHARLAAILGVGVPAVSHRATRENWSPLDFRRTGLRTAHAALMRLAGRAIGEGQESEGWQAGSAGGEGLEPGGGQNGAGKRRGFRSGSGRAGR